MKLLSLEQVSAAAGGNEEATMLGMEDKGEQERLYYKGLMLEVENNAVGQ
jgi:hypothetical protein